MKKLIGLSAAVLSVALALCPSVSALAARDALSMCAMTLIPSLFPFFVCANLLILSGMTARAGRVFEKTSRRLFGVGGEGASAVLLGLISGYPGGAAVTASIYTSGGISRTEANRLLAFTNNAGPLFIIGVIGMGVYHSTGVGYILLAAQTMASLSVGLCMRFFGKDEAVSRKNRTARRMDPMGDAVQTMLTLCGFVVFFSVVAAFLEAVGLLSAFRRFLEILGVGTNTAALISVGLLEITTAAGAAPASIPAMAGLISFGGLSVFLQTASIAKKAGLSVKQYAIGKVLSAGLSAFFCRILLQIFPKAVTVSLSPTLAKSTAIGAYLAASTLFIIAVYLFFAILEKFSK